MRSRRNHLIYGLGTLAVLVGVALTATPTQANSGPGPYLPTPAWDRHMPAATRFEVLTNWNHEAVLDKETGLVWERTPALAARTWADARYQCVNRIIGNRLGWRLPSVHELGSLVYPGLTPALPPGHPFINVQLLLYWSATTIADIPTDAWAVDFSTGFVVGGGFKTQSNPAWCVRGGNNAEAY